MKRLQLINIVDKKYRKIEIIFKEVIPEFKTNDIHRFRVEVKKLRSILRLASASKRKGIRLAIPEKVRRFYNAVGAIRSLQLQQQDIKELPQEEYSVLLKQYSNFITNRIADRITVARKLVKGKKPFAKGRQELLSRLPSNVKPATIRTFTSDKLEALTRLMHPASLSDESLHSVRKLLKDILYTLSYSKKFKTSIHPKSLMSEEEISSVIKILGEFQDKCVNLDLLHIHYKKQQSGSQERVLWRRLENRWWNEKEINRSAIHALFHKVLFLSLNHQRFRDNSLPLPIKLLAL